MAATSWDHVKWMFEPDGALRDIYVQESTIQDWDKLVDLLNDDFSVKFGTSDRIDKQTAFRQLHFEEVPEYQH